MDESLSDVEMEALLGTTAVGDFGGEEVETMALEYVRCTIRRAIGRGFRDGVRVGYAAGVKATRDAAVAALGALDVKLGES